VAIPWLSWIPAAGRWLWSKIRGRPTVQADRGAVAAGRDQAIKDSVLSTEQALRGEMGAFVADIQHFHGSVTIINLPRYADHLPDVALEGPPESYKEGERLEAAGDHDGAVTQYEKAFAAAQDDYNRSVLHIRIARNLAELNRPAEAEGHLLQALDLAQRASEPKLEAFALWNLGLGHRQQGCLEEAETCITQALETYERLGELEGQAFCLGDLANLHRQRGDPGHVAKAEDLYRRALKIYEDLGYRWGRAATLHNLGLLYDSRTDPGRAEKAEECYLAASQLHSADGDILQQAHALNKAGRAALTCGHHAPSLERCSEALALFEQAGDQKGTAEALANLGIIHLYLAYARLAVANLGTIYLERAQLEHPHEHVEQAHAHIVRSLALYHELGDLRNEALGTVALSHALFLRLDFPGAKHKLRHAQELFSQAEDQHHARALDNLIESLERLERLEPASPPKPKPKSGPKKPPPKPC